VFREGGPLDAVRTIPFVSRAVGWLVVTRCVRGSRSERTSGIRPPVGPGHRVVEVIDEGHYPILEFVGRGEASSVDQLAGQGGKPDLHLVHPGRVFRSVDKLDSVGRVSKECRSGFHGFQNARLPLCPKIILDSAPMGHEADQSFRFVRVELIQDEHPSRVRVSVDSPFHVSGKIPLISGRTNGGRDDTARCHIEVGGKTLGTIADVFKFLTFRRSRCHGQGGMDSLQSLNAGLLVGADDMDPFFLEFRSLPVKPTD
jgi:hypothetical protein